jgi:hypothetical protein
MGITLDGFKGLLSVERLPMYIDKTEKEAERLLLEYSSSENQGRVTARVTFSHGLCWYVVPHMQFTMRSSFGAESIFGLEGCVVDLFHANPENPDAWENELWFDVYRRRLSEEKLLDPFIDMLRLNMMSSVFQIHGFMGEVEFEFDAVPVMQPVRINGPGGKLGGRAQFHSACFRARRQSGARRGSPRPNGFVLAGT